MYDAGRVRRGQAVGELATDLERLGQRERALEVYQQLFSYGDTELLSQIENARVPRSYFAIFERAIEKAQVYDFACVSHLGKIDNPDMVAEMADFMLRMKGCS